MTFRQKFGHEYACHVCDGVGIIKRRRWVFFGKIITKKCSTCHGSGIDPRKKKAYFRDKKRYEKSGGA